MAYALEFSWYDADDDRTRFNDGNGFRVRAGSLGLDVAPVELTMSPRIGAAGSLLVNERTAARPIVLPLYITSDGDGAQANVNRLARILANSPGRVRVDDGTNTRELHDVVYEAGLEGRWDAAAMSLGSDTWRMAAVSLVAADPWWYATSDTTQDLNDGATGFDTSTPFSADWKVFDGGQDNTITVDGDTDPFLTWTLTGAMTGFYASDVDGNVLRLVTTIGTGDVLVIGTDPTDSDSYGPRLNGAPPDWSILSASTRFPVLMSGANTVTVGVNGGDGSTDVDVAWRERYRTL